MQPYTPIATRKPKSILVALALLQYRAAAHVIIFWYAGRRDESAI